MAQKVLTESERNKLHQAQARIDRAEAEWAAVVRKLGVAAVAREIGLTPQGLLRRVQRVEERSTETG